MLRDQRRELVEPGRVDRFDCLRDGRVGARSPLAELRLVGDRLGERVLELVLRLGIQRLLEDELCDAEG